MVQKIILIFGATGATGTHLVKHAIESGYIVKAFVRNADKLWNKFPEYSVGPTNLITLEADMTNYSAVISAMEGVDYVVSTAGGPKSNKNYPKGFMLDFIRALVDGCRIHEVKRLVFQAGAFSPIPGEPLKISIKFMRFLVGRMMGITYMLKDNDDVIKYLHNCTDINWTVTRPGMIKEMGEKGDVSSSEKMSMKPISFIDLAHYTLALLTTYTHKHECPYVVYK